MSLSLEKQRFMMVVVLVLWCSALSTLNNYLAADMVSIGLLWNLFLALLPLFWSSAFQAASSSNRPIFAFIPFVLWLLFLPNAPYLLTDLVHLGYRPTVPLWCRLAMLLSFAGTGTLLGYLSLQTVQAAIEKRWGKTTGWGLAVFALMASGFGIYLGRFLRWNSWDALTHPLSLVKTMARQLLHPAPHPHPIPVTLVFGIGLIIGYLAIRIMAPVPASHFEPTHE